MYTGGLFLFALQDALMRHSIRSVHNQPANWTNARTNTVQRWKKKSVEKWNLWIHVISSKCRKICFTPEYNITDHSRVLVIMLVLLSYPLVPLLFHFPLLRTVLPLCVLQRASALEVHQHRQARRDWSEYIGDKWWRVNSAAARSFWFECIYANHCFIVVAAWSERARALLRGWHLKRWIFEDPWINLLIGIQYTHLAWLSSSLSLSLCI